MKTAASDRNKNLWNWLNIIENLCTNLCYMPIYLASEFIKSDLNNLLYIDNCV